ncbi:Peptidase A1 domain-containing protein [Aphelenchoides bicaudatus]|nr:Peptidase A1 domain-containing protein [Aphelenchoides bicaudatus]
MQIGLALFLIMVVVNAEEGLVEIPIQQHFVSRNVLKSRQAIQMKQLGLGGGFLRPNSDAKPPTNPFSYLTANMSFGTPEKSFTVLFSGSSRAWLFGKQFTGRNIYRPEDSSTSKNLHRNFNQSDGPFNVNSSCYSDTMRFGGVKVKIQAFGVAYQLDEPANEQFPADGSLGLNHLIPDAYTNYSEPTAPIDNILRPLLTKTYTFFLDQKSGNGTFTLGGLDKKNCQDNVYRVYKFNQIGKDMRYYLPVYEFGYPGYSSSTGGLGYVDFGFSAIMLPFADALGVYSASNANYDWETGLYLIRCNTTFSRSMYIEMKDGSLIDFSKESVVVDIGLNDGSCVLAIDVVGDSYPNNTYVLGAPLARQWCAVMDLNTNELKTHYRAN